MDNIEKTTDSISLGNALSRGFAFYKANFTLLVTTGALCLLCALITSFITFKFGPYLGRIASMAIISPFFVAYSLLMLDLLNGNKREFSDLFKGLDLYRPAALSGVIISVVCIAIGVVLSVVPFFGTILSMVATAVVMAMFMFVPMLIAHRRLDAVTAIKTSVELVKPRLLNLLLISFVAGLIGMAGAFIFVIGAVITMPLYFATIASVYYDLEGSTQTTIHTV